MNRSLQFLLILLVYVSVSVCNAFHFTTENSVLNRGSRGATLQMRKAIIAGNWKLNTDLTSATSLAKDIGKLTADVKEEEVEMVVIPPFPFITSVRANIGDKVKLGAQHCWYEESGAYTSAVSVNMLKSIGCKYVLVGHSERRNIFKETDEDFNKMLKKVLEKGMTPILCIGELKEEFELNVCRETCTVQLAKCLADIPAEEVKKIVIAYEPVWAIGTGLTATPQIAQTVHKSIRLWLRDTYGNEVAETIPIQYGGSVTPETVNNLMSQPDIDGALVGGASLKADSFEKLVKFKATNPMKDTIIEIYNKIGQTTKAFVSTAACLSIIFSRNWLATYFVAGGIANALLSKILKNIVKQPRPATASLTEYGMPSSHTQSLFYFSTVIIASLIQTKPLLCVFISLYSLLAASWRVYSGLHTTSQTAVGATIGTFVGYFFHKNKQFVSNFLRIGMSDCRLRIFSNKFVALNSLLLTGATILYGPEIKNALLNSNIDKKNVEN